MVQPSWLIYGTSGAAAPEHGGVSGTPAVGDFNGDGLDDAYVCGSLFYSTGAGSFTAGDSGVDARTTCDTAAGAGPTVGDFNGVRL